MDTTTITMATPAKLRNGTWGAKVTTDRVHPGDRLLITTRSGKQWEARVGRVLWTGDGAALVTTVTDQPAPSNSRRGGYGRRRECITGGNCSSFGDSRSCGGYDCDGF